MKISPVKNRSKVITVHEQVGRALIKQGKFVLATAELKAEPKIVIPEGASGEKPMADTPDVEISPRTGLPKRTYRRRDMEAE